MGTSQKTDFNRLAPVASAAGPFDSFPFFVVCARCGRERHLRAGLHSAAARRQLQPGGNHGRTGENNDFCSKSDITGRYTWSTTVFS